MKKVLKVVIVVAIVIAILIGIGIVSVITKERLPEKQVVMSDNAKYFKEKSNSIPRVLPVEEAVSSGYFVYDGIENKLYNKNVLDGFIENASSNTADEIVIVVYNVNGDPFISHVAYRAGKGYILAKDNTRVDVLKTELVNNDGMVMAEPEFYDVVVKEDIPSEYYEISLTEEVGINAGIISFKVQKDTKDKAYKSIEIARFLLDAEVVQD